MSAAGATAAKALSRAAANAIAHRFAKYGPTVWAEFTRLAQVHKAVNLGQGFPVLERVHHNPDLGRAIAAAATTTDGEAAVTMFQYARAQGHLRLTRAISKLYEPLLDHSVDPMTDVVVVNGATQALHDTMLGILNPGDEAILLDPCYDSYIPSVESAGATPVRVALDFAKPQLPIAAIEKAITKRTRLLLLNTPHNPSGNIFPLSELQKVAELCIRHDILCISDEVYEFLVCGADPEPLPRIASLPGMWDRTLTICSGGKTFSSTGVKIGWVIGPAHLIRCTMTSHQFNVFCVNTVGQEAVAVSLENLSHNGFLERQAAAYTLKRDRLCRGLREIGLEPHVPAGAYFVMADTSKVKNVPLRAAPTDTRDYALCRSWIEQASVVAIPPSIFYSAANAHLGENWVRFAFCKRDDMLDAAVRNLGKHLQF